LVEYGTRERFHANGKSVGVMPSFPYVRPSFEATKGKILSLQTKLVGDKIISIMRRRLGKSFISVK